MWSWWQFLFWMDSRWIHFGPWLSLWSYLFLFNENRRSISSSIYTLKAEFLFHFELKVWVWLRSQPSFCFVACFRTVPKRRLWTRLHCFWLRWNFILLLCVCTSCSVWLLKSEILFNFLLSMQCCKWCMLLCVLPDAYARAKLILFRNMTCLIEAFS